MDEKLVRKKYEEFTRLLIEKGLSITTMESATSGQIASLITDTQGASAIFKGALITYSNSAKIQMGVPAEIIEKYSVYSKETAMAMAKVCRNKFMANIGIGVTGTMGNIDPANKQASVPGQVYFAISTENREESFFVELSAQENRLAYKLAVAELVLEECKKIVLNKVVKM